MFKTITFIYLFSFISFHAFAKDVLPGNSLEKIGSTPIIALESLYLDSYEILKQFDVKIHLPECQREKFGHRFKDRNRCVYLSPNNAWVIKVWQENYPPAALFFEAFLSGFYDKISPVRAIIFDKNRTCRGYITPFLISREQLRSTWEAVGFSLRKNPIGVKIFDKYENQPQAYKNLFDELIKQTKNTGFILTDFCPNNVAVDPDSGRLYLIDLEDVEKITNLPLSDRFFQGKLQYNPLDYLKILNDLSKEPFCETPHRL